MRQAPTESERKNSRSSSPSVVTPESPLLSDPVFSFVVIAASGRVVPFSGRSLRRRGPRSPGRAPRPCRAAQASRSRGSLRPALQALSRRPREASKAPIRQMGESPGLSGIHDLVIGSAPARPERVTGSNPFGALQARSVGRLHSASPTGGMTGAEPCVSSDPARKPTRNRSSAAAAQAPPSGGKPSGVASEWYSVPTLFIDGVIYRGSNDAPALLDLLGEQP